MTTSAQQILNLEDLFGAPLVSTVNADLMAARQFMEFIEEYGFEPVDDDGAPVDDSELSEVSGKQHFGKLKMITFRYETKDLNGNSKYSIINVPALSLMPLPILQVSDASFDFDVKLLASTAMDTSDVYNSSSSESDSEEGPDYDIKATLGPNSNSSDDSGINLSANMKVKLNMRQADIPNGISTLLNVMDQSVYNEQTTVPAEGSAGNEGQ